ncbi:hypothetical protein BP00DRAFT_452603, partial [Aspergillus indologenus CBS 114.80]
MSAQEFGFIGLGVMGYPMALNLLKKLTTKKRLHVYDVSNEAVEKLMAEGQERVSRCGSARE